MDKLVCPWNGCHRFPIRTFGNDGLGAGNDGLGAGNDSGGCSGIYLESVKLTD